jgi:hypothetical protein
MVNNGEITLGQLIWEETKYENTDTPEWVHISLPTAKKNNQQLRCYKPRPGCFCPGKTYTTKACYAGLTTLQTEGSKDNPHPEELKPLKK